MAVLAFLWTALFAACKPFSTLSIQVIPYSYFLLPRITARGLPQFSNSLNVWCSNGNLCERTEFSW